MSPTVLKPGNHRRAEPGSRSLSFGRVVRKSALLNVAIVLTSFPVLVFAGGPNTLVPAVAIMAAISVLIWAFTFALFSFVSLPRILFWQPTPPGKGGQSSPPPAEAAGVADRWLDGPV